LVSALICQWPNSIQKLRRERYWAQVARRGRTQVGDRQALLQLDLRLDLGQHLLNQVWRQAGAHGCRVAVPLVMRLPWEDSLAERETTAHLAAGAADLPAVYAKTGQATSAPPTATAGPRSWLCLRESSCQISCGIAGMARRKGHATLYRHPSRLDRIDSGRGRCILSCRPIARLVGRRARIDSARLDTDMPARVTRAAQPKSL
jgi:hypothetical protein